MSVNIRNYVSNDHIESIGEIAKSQSAIIQALSLDNSKLEREIERLNNIINESAEEILKELEENRHLSYGVALAIRQKLLDYKELKGE